MPIIARLTKHLKTLLNIVKYVKHHEPLVKHDETLVKQCETLKHTTFDAAASVLSTTILAVNGAIPVLGMVKSAPCA